MDAIAVPTEADWPAVWAALEHVVLPQNLPSGPSGLAKHQAPILALIGDLGAGKTTFVKTIAAALGSEVPVTSPTFSIVQEYPTPEGPIYHFDLYRLNDVAELEDLDFEDYLRRGRLVVVEWPQLAEGWLRALGAISIKIEQRPGGGRTVLNLSPAR